ncbi:MAG: hypothetical protein H6Q74_2681 [Firmicutes bacterium]|nr:hypothetical protein [Bacillota bacterium]
MKSDLFAQIFTKMVVSYRITSIEGFVLTSFNTKAAVWAAFFVICRTYNQGYEIDFIGILIKDLFG